MFLSSSFSKSAFSYDIVLWFMFQLMDLIFNLRICFLDFEYGHVLWSYVFWLSILSCITIHDFSWHVIVSFVLCHVPSRVWVSELCKRLVLCFTLHVFHILLCLCSQPCYRFSVYVTVLHISHVSRLSIEYQVWGIFIVIITSFWWTTV